MLSAISLLLYQLIYIDIDFAFNDFSNLKFQQYLFQLTTTQLKILIQNLVAFFLVSSHFFLLMAIIWFEIHWISIVTILKKKITPPFGLSFYCFCVCGVHTAQYQYIYISIVSNFIDEICYFSPFLAHLSLSYWIGHFIMQTSHARTTSFAAANFPTKKEKSTQNKRTISLNFSVSSFVGRRYCNMLKLCPSNDTNQYCLLYKLINRTVQSVGASTKSSFLISNEKKTHIFVYRWWWMYLCMPTSTAFDITKKKQFFPSPL